MFKGKLRSLRDKIGNVLEPITPPEVAKVENPPDADEFFCEKCGRNHKLDSKIGKEHLPKVEEKPKKKKSMTKEKVFTALVALTIGAMGVLGCQLAVTAYSGSANIVVEGDMHYTEAPDAEFGVAAGPFHTERQFFTAGFQYGSPVYATSGYAASATLVAADIDQDVSYIEFDPYSPTLNTLTVPASSTFTGHILGNNAGDTREYMLHVASSTAGITLYLAENTGMNFLVNNDSTSSTILTTNEFSKLTLIREASSDISVLIEGYQEYND